MAEQSGSAVEREARQLVEAAARWLSAVPTPQEPAEERHTEYAEATPGQESARAPRGAPAPQAESAGDPTQHAGREQLCQDCPWCRAKAAAGPLGADTLDSLAHLLSAAAESLSLWASSRREAQGHRDPAPEEAARDSAQEDDPRAAESWSGPDPAAGRTTAAAAEVAEPHAELIEWEDDPEEEDERREDDPHRTKPHRTKLRSTGGEGPREGPTG